MVIPFPFVGIELQKTRPALVLSSKEFNQTNGYFLAAMITSAKNSSWLGDTLISRVEETGLKVDCLIRLKIFCLPHQIEPRVVGRLSEDDQRVFKSNWVKYII
ncbi:MAG: type II toxin-antitoxin system PemK/MazF family toxin [Bacteroidetes bacterium]|nr:type II toxin-antitoxin system PemK/MazF family toxin [Bacteroidota bacterium]MDA1121796.1 type II toxin-antitoxin system PemK/MazF family toxin [Bacteroidota bacterium]